MSIKDLYQSLIESGKLDADDDQREVVDRFYKLQRRLVEQHTFPARIRRWLPGSKHKAVIKGIYLWGGVGRGKTVLMDLFYSSLQVDTKRRTHFHRMMRDVHRRLGNLNDVKDPLDVVASDIADEVSVLCFDEFFVSDIGDAMILGRLLDGLFCRGVTLVATSNTHPKDLYRDGLQRQRLIPAIKGLEAHTDVIKLIGETDYRLRLFQQAGTYLVPADGSANRKLLHYFEEIASGEIQDQTDIHVLGRTISARRCAKSIVWFEFDEICDGPRSQDDYIELGRCYPTVIVSGIPIFDSNRENSARRFISLVDEFYYRRVKLVVSATTGIENLYQGYRLKMEFERTASRLAEMQTETYLHSPHLA